MVAFAAAAGQIVDQRLVAGKLEPIVAPVEEEIALWERD